MPGQAYTKPGTHAWVCPAGVTSIIPQVWAAGGGGGGTAGFGAAAGGGGGGEYASEPAVSVTPGRTYTVTVGAGGAGGKVPLGGGPASDGAAGGRSSFTGDTVTITAAGGQGGRANGAAGAGGTGSTSTIHFAGGPGGLGDHTSAGGGGGGSGGTTGGGNAASNGSVGGAGAAAVPGGGPGGSGGASGPGHTPASGPGGGGGGAASPLGLATPEVGGAGFAGQVTLTYNLATQPAVPLFQAGYGPVPGDFDSWVQAPFQALTAKVLFRAEFAGLLILANTLNTKIPFDTILEDPLGGWNPATSTWLCPAAWSGTYVISVTASALPAADNVTSLRSGYGLNGTAAYDTDVTWVGNAIPGIASGAGPPIQLYGGQDSVFAYANYQSTSFGQPVSTPGQRCAMEITWFSL